MNSRAWATFVVTIALAAAGCNDADLPTACDRTCLIGIADAYLAALATRDPGESALADDVAFVENVTRRARDEGLWASAVRVDPTYRIYVPDPDAGSIGIMTVVDRETTHGVEPAQLAVRLKVEGGRITEAEHLVAAIENAEARAHLAAPRPNLTAPVAEAARMPRAELAAIAASYYDSLDASDGTLAPFAEDCERLENGFIAAGPGLAPEPFASVDVGGRSPPPVARDCIGQMSSRRFAYIDSIDNRRIFAVDPVQGLAMGLSHFRQSMSRGPQPMIAADGTLVMWEEKRDPYDLPAAHIFKIAGGQIHEVEALGIFIPYDSPTGWE
jgi:hypothetical protein